MQSAIIQRQNKSLVSLDSSLWGMVFLFPVLAVSIKSWTSVLHLALAIACIIWLVKNQRWHSIKLKSMEKLFLACLLLSFVWYLFGEYANGWQAVKPHWPLIDFRYVLIIPVFLVFRHLGNGYNGLLRGAIAGCIAAAIVAAYQAFYLNANPPMGAYHHLFLGPASGAMSLLIFYSYPHTIKNPTWRYLAYFGILCGLFTLVLSTARSGYLATLVLLLLFPLLTGRVSIKRSLAYLLFLCVTAVSVYNLSGSVRTEMQDTVKGFQNHLHQLSLSREEFHQSKLDNVTIRFELWRIALQLSKENLLYGIGRTGYPRLLSQKIDTGEVHPQLRVANQGVIDQPHNAYLYHLVTRGVIGLVFFVSIMLVPLIIFLRHWNRANTEARLGVVWVLFFSVVSLTQSSVFARGHYLSLFLVVLTILLASCIRRANDNQS